MYISYVCMVRRVAMNSNEIGFLIHPASVRCDMVLHQAFRVKTCAKDRHRR